MLERRIKNMQRINERERLFINRRDAGRYLAERLNRYANKQDVIVLALPRGGVPVAYEIAQKLNAPLDIFLVRKLGAPLYEELAMGAIATGGIRVLNTDVIKRLRITPEMIEAAAEEQGRELNRREQEYRGDREPPELAGKTVILVDDGLATGASMRAAVGALKQYHPARIIVAVPVGAPEICGQFEDEVDEVICGKTPADFGAVGAWYEDFRQTTDEEVCELLDSTAHQKKVRDLAAKYPERYSDLSFR
jgi:putative phosphoribosyl transferase